MKGGAWVALVTPFKDGKVDEEDFRKLVEFQIESGIDGLVPCGTTGEAASFSKEEHRKVIEITVDQACQRVPVIAGAGSNSTEETIRLTRAAKEAGADGALLITPYYNKPSQEGLYRHYKAVAEEVDLPIIFYNIPSRTGVNLLPETVHKLSKMDNIVGIKEASGNLLQASEIMRLCGSEFLLMSGDDFLLLPILSIGGKGVISVVANIVPKEVLRLCKSFSQGNIKEAMDLHYKLFPLIKAMSIDTNPIPVKTALYLMGKISPEFRLPLCSTSEGNEKILRESLREYGLL